MTGTRGTRYGTGTEMGHCCGSECTTRVLVYRSELLLLLLVVLGIAGGADSKEILIGALDTPGSVNGRAVVSR